MPKPHKGTHPKLFYVGIEGDLLQPTMMRPEHGAMWADHNPLGDERPVTGEKNEVAAPGSARIVYDIAHAAPWGAIHPAYLWTKSIAAGVLLVASMLLGAGFGASDEALLGIVSPIFVLVFLGITVTLLIADLKQPWRFYYLITKPNPKSWLVWGTYILIVYGALGLGWLACSFFLHAIPVALVVGAAVSDTTTACYTAFLFAQAKGRDLWQSQVFIWHLLVQALIGGAALMIIIA